MSNTTVNKLFLATALMNISKANRKELPDPLIEALTNEMSELITDRINEFNTKVSDSKVSEYTASYELVRGTNHIVDLGKFFNATVEDLATYDDIIGGIDEPAVTFSEDGLVKTTQEYINKHRLIIKDELKRMMMDNHVFYVDPDKVLDNPMEFVGLVTQALENLKEAKLLPKY